MKVVILGANGTMGAPAGAVFASAGFDVVMLARDLEKAQTAVGGAQTAARAEAVAELVKHGTYDRDLERTVADADLIFESLAEDLNLKKTFFERVDKCRRPDSIVATGSSGLSIAEMARGRSDSFRQHFLGIHLFNPPQVIVGAEVIPQDATDPKVTANACEMLAHRLGRKVIVTGDRPAFVGNRVGFKVLNECAELSEEHGVAFIDYVVGPQTGRAMAPLATIDLVGWDVHKAIVDNVYANTEDEAHSSFRLPAFMERGVKEGRLGDKTPKEGGFYRKDGKATAGARSEDRILSAAGKTALDSVRGKDEAVQSRGPLSAGIRGFRRGARPRSRPRAKSDPWLRQLRAQSGWRGCAIGRRRRHHHVVWFQLGAAERDRRSDRREAHRPDVRALQSDGAAGG